MSAEGNFADMLPEVFRTSFNSLFFGSVFPVKAALPEIIKTRGHIVFISSLAGFYGLRRYSAYSSGKMALTALAQSIRAETANTGIHVGIAYVGLTQNEKSKTTLNADGELVLVPPRPAHLQQTREKVAEGIAKMILKRQKRKVFSLIGVIQDALIRFTPSLFRQIAKKL
jgi:short-subunit dehydrogenase